MIKKIIMVVAALSSAAARTVTAIREECFLLDGFDMINGCKAPAAVIPPDCSLLDNEDDTSACLAFDTSIREEIQYE